MKDMQVGNSSKGPEFEINFIILRALGFGVAMVAQQMRIWLT